MPNLQRHVGAGDRATLVPSFPAVTWPVQANMLTGVLPAEHGVVANGFFWRDECRVEMWTAGNERIERPQLWDVLHQPEFQRTSAAWFPMLSKRCGADFICMPAPIHNPDGSESLWCYTRPTELYGELRDQLGHFPLQHFWGPLANIQSTSWIAASAGWAAQRNCPNLMYVYLPHLDYAAQKAGPDSSAAIQACRDLDDVLGEFFATVGRALPADDCLWLIASEYTIVPVQHVLYPNRILRTAGLLSVRPDTPDSAAEELDLENSRAWALVDHQYAHVYVRDAADVGAVVDQFRHLEGVSEVLTTDDLGRYRLDHARSGEVVVVSEANSWQAYYWWFDDARAPSYARTVDIHRKPGYDPVELHFDPQSRSIPLDATLVCGSHGAPATHDAQRGVLLSSQRGVISADSVADTDVFEIVMRQFRP